MCAHMSDSCLMSHSSVMHTCLILETWWYRVRRCIGCLKLQISFHTRAANYRAVLWKMTYKDKAFYVSSPPCMRCSDKGSPPVALCVGCLIFLFGLNCHTYMSHSFLMFRSIVMHTCLIHCSCLIQLSCINVSCLKPDGKTYSEGPQMHSNLHLLLACIWFNIYVYVYIHVYIYVYMYIYLYVRIYI